MLHPGAAARGVARRDVLYEPHAVARMVKLPAITLHGAGVHVQHDRPPTPSADHGGRRLVGREVYMVTSHALEAPAPDSRQLALGGARWEGCSPCASP